MNESHQTKSLKVLRVDASGRSEGSVSRALGAEVLDQLWRGQYHLEVTHRDLAIDAPPFVNAGWIGATFTPEHDRNPDQRAALGQSDEMVTELQDADVVLIATPVYNFGVPAALKAWIDMIARVGKTFRYTENGPEGLLRGKRAILVVATGGTAVDSDIDFATPYLRHVLGFIGITDVEVIAADRLMRRGEEATSAARSDISRLVDPATATASAA